MGKLYVIATPIGNLADLSQRAMDTLAAVDVIAAEDTRHTGRLLQSLGITTPMVSFHDHNEQGRVPQLIARLLDGESVGLVSDAGTPLVSDPGYSLVNAAAAAGVEISPIAGPSAVMAALSVSGLPVSGFTFHGFLPRKGARARLEAIASNPATQVFYEAPGRVGELLALAAEVLGGDRPAAVARELTKLHEQVVRGSLDELLVQARSGELTPRGEFVVMFGGKPPRESKVDGELAGSVETLIDVLLQDLPVKRIADVVSKVSGIPRKVAYDLVVERKNAGRYD